MAVVDKVSSLTLTCQELITTLEQRISSLEYVLDHVTRTVTRVEHISLTMMHLESAMERCKAVDKEGEQILKAALHSCKTIFGGLANAQDDITKVKECLERLRADPHHPCHLQDLEEQVGRLHGRLQALSEDIANTRTNLNQRLELWQKFTTDADALNSFLQEVEYLMESALEVPRVNQGLLRGNVAQLQTLQGNMERNQPMIEDLKKHSLHVEKTEVCQLHTKHWNTLSNRLSEVILRQETVLEMWTQYVSVQESVRTWVETKISLIVTLQTRRVLQSDDHKQIQVLASEATWSGERVSELRDLAEQIQIKLMADQAKLDSPLLAQVESLGTRISSLTDAITQLSSNIARSQQKEKHPQLAQEELAIVAVSPRQSMHLNASSECGRQQLQVAQLQSWLLALEQEVQDLQLKQVPHKRLGKIDSRLHHLMHQVEMSDEAWKSLCELDSASQSPDMQTELGSLHQRVINLRRNLYTWMAYLTMCSKRWTAFHTYLTQLQETLSQYQDSLDAPTDSKNIQENMALYHGVAVSLESLTGDVEHLQTMREEMVDGLTPADSRLVTQRMWGVTQRHAQLLHQYRLKISTLEDQLELWELYNTRYIHFLKWAKDMETKIDGGSEQYIDTLIRKLDHDYQQEINTKSIEKLWLISEGEELLQCSDSDQVAEINKMMDVIKVTWKSVNDKCNTRKQKLQDIVTTITRAEIILGDLKEWLFTIEKKLSSPVIFQNKSKREINKLLEVEDDLKKEIENQSSTISSVLNLCDMVIRDCQEFEASGDGDSLSEAHNNLEKRWGDICTRSAERKVFIKKTWKMWQELEEVHEPFGEWLTHVETRVASIRGTSSLLPYNEVTNTIRELHELQQEIHDHTPGYELLNQNYRKLAAPYGRENRLDQKDEIRGMVKTANSRFHKVSHHVSVLLRRLRYSVNLLEEFETKRECLMTWLVEYEKQLTEHEQETSLSKEAVLPNLVLLVREYEGRQEELKYFEEMIILLFQRSCYTDCIDIEESLNDYWNLRSLLNSRIVVLKDSMPDMTVEDLQEEQDSSSKLISDVDGATTVAEAAADITGANLSSQSLTTELNVSTVGGRSLATELKVALDETQRQLQLLEEAINGSTPKGADDTDKTYYSFCKQLAACRSSVDLLVSLSKHMSDNAEAQQLAPQITSVIEEFRQLEVRAQTKQSRLKENSETSSLTCPLCCRRNWHQFENDMWRLEQWLGHSQATQSQLTSVPMAMEDLEEAAQDHREFLMDLDGHKSVIMSLNIIGKHLAEHARDAHRGTAVRERLSSANHRWDQVCTAASSWQAKLQTALMANSEFHSTISDLLIWTEATEAELLRLAADLEETDSEGAEPLMLRERQAARILEVRAEVERCQPRVSSLHEAAQHLLPCDPQQDHAASSNSTTVVRENLYLLSRRLQILLQLCSQQLHLLGGITGQDIGAASMASLASSGLYESTSSSSEFTFSQRSRPMSPSLSLTQSSLYSDTLEGGEESEDANGVVRRSYMFLGRVMRAALPIQALMLLMLGAASLVPTSEDDYSCSMANSFARSLDPMFRYTNGPPPF
ncbi:unnamed protein product [Meganyctiphanes norvegica]|uniref:KASH domain-containing protein n=1 Tax=Meganyctiphanes norvegica TaxID=48144 RepID=A0AAV2SES9_MEGNR